MPTRVPINWSTRKRSRGSKHLVRHSVLLLSDLPHAELADLARWVENRGFDGIWYADERFYHEPYVGLAAIAMSTEKIFLGPGVTDPKSRHPGLTASAINSINEMSGGRALLGIGAGKSGFHNLGLTTARSAVGIKEAVVAIRRLLEGERVTLDGEVVYLDDAGMRVDSEPVPICVAANGPLTLRTAGEVADIVMIPHCRSLDLLAHKMRSVEEGVERAGRDSMPEVILRLDTSVDEDGAAAEHMAKTRLGRTLWAAYPRIPFLEALDIPLPEELDRRLHDAGPFQYTFDLTAFERFADAIPDEILAAVCLAGTPSQVAEQVAVLESAGVNEVNIHPVPPPGKVQENVMDLYAAAVMSRPD